MEVLESSQTQNLGKPCMLSYIVIFAHHYTVHQAHAMHVLPRTDSHVENTFLGHIVDQFLRNMLACGEIQYTSTPFEQQQH